MPHTHPITLRLTAQGIDAYCRALSRRSPSLEKRVSAIDALITFLSTQTDAGEQATPEFSAIKRALLAHFDEARAALLDERATRLLQALRSKSVWQLVSLYTSISRDAFWTLLGRVEPEFDANALEGLREWAAGWLRGPKHAEENSPFPDAIDFKAAGVDASEYLTMSEVCRFLGLIV